MSTGESAGDDAPDLLAHLAWRLPSFTPAPGRSPRPLKGGQLNRVWRMRGSPQSVVCKWAPPYVASMPQIPLDPARLSFEAAALAELSPGGGLAAVSAPEARAPRLLDFDPEAALLVMEDAGKLPDLAALLAGPRVPTAAVRALGAFVGRLHRRSHAAAAPALAPALARRFDNAAIQKSRLDVQYRAIGSFFVGAASAELGPIAVNLGERLLGPGRCLTMGDLWPASVLVDPADAAVTVIDWEFCHYGNPAQDLGHLAAHLFLARAVGAWRVFVNAYVGAIGPQRADLLDDAVLRDTALHFGCEIAARVRGPFRLRALHCPESEALAAAASSLRQGTLPVSWQFS